MEFLLSVIVPVYNAMYTIERCVNSIIEQTYKNLEVIIIDDGSKDESGAICEKFTKIDKRVKVYHTVNKGVSQARNFGLKISKGDLIIFVDSDDWIEPTMAKAMINCKINTNTDLVICGYQNVFFDKILSKCVKKEKKLYTKQEFMVNFGNLYKKVYLSGPCCKLYVSKIIKNNSLNFNSKLSIGEDLIFNLQYYELCKDIYFTSNIFYNYLIIPNGDSLSNKLRDDKIDIQFFLYNEVVKFCIRNNGLTEANYNDINCVFFNHLYAQINRIIFSDYKLNAKILKLKFLLNKYADLKFLKKIKIEKKSLIFIRKIICSKNIFIIFFFIKIKKLVKGAIKCFSKIK